MNRKITPGQIRRLQVLYGQLARHTLQGADRAARLEWAEGLVMHPVASFSALSGQDAHHLIDTLQGQLGISAPPRKRLDREAARKAGTEGRRGYESKETTLVGAADLARIQRMLDLLGWSRQSLENWLHSKHSPLQSKATPVIQTLYDANRVYWALKGIATAQGKLPGKRAQQ